MEEKFGPLKKGQKTIDINRDEIFQKNCRAHTFLTTEGMKKFLEELEVEPVDDNLRICKSNWPRQLKEWTATGWQK
jgi:hypothetical protein